MSENVISGMDALNALNDDGGNNANDVEFTTFSSGTTLLVKVIGKEVEVNGKKQHIGDFISYFNYGVYKKVNSFTAKNPSKKSAKGYPVERLTPWDEAWKYHADKSEEFQDTHSQEANKYRPKQKFAFGFVDLDSGKPIIVDLTKNQAKAVNNAIKKFGKKLDKAAFELSKEGKSTNTVVSLSPVLDMDEDITEKQRKNFDNAPKEFDMTLFEGLLYEADNDEMIELLIQSGFDISNIGLEKPKQNDEKEDDEDENENEGSEEGKPIDINDDDLPF